MDGNSQWRPSIWSPSISVEMAEAGGSVLEEEADYLIAERAAVKVYLAMEEVRRRRVAESLEDLEQKDSL
ncbi:hypothetical protein [Methylocystis sp.]|uniref:hypothetical protein n=1 Tax=Methylocystis sp. TaxID=1911079 RepID=UPI0025CF7067|nr:hypothetical protein [Methylocystis sp.]